MANRFSPASTAIVVLAVASAAAMTLNRGSLSASLDALAARALARIDGETTIPGLQADVRVIRDTWGVPHIYANSDTDLFFAQGYAAVDVVPGTAWGGPCYVLDRTGEAGAGAGTSTRRASPKAATRRKTTRSTSPRKAPRAARRRAARAGRGRR